MSGRPRSSPRGLSPPPPSSVISSELGQGVQGCETAKAHTVRTDADQDVGALRDIQAWKTPRATGPNFFILQVGKRRLRNTHTGSAGARVEAGPPGLMSNWRESNLSPHPSVHSAGLGRVRPIFQMGELWLSGLSRMLCLEPLAVPNRPSMRSAGRPHS